MVKESQTLEKAEAPGFCKNCQFEKHSDHFVNACHSATTLLIRNNAQLFGTENNLAIAENPCAVYRKCEFPKIKLFIIFDLIFTNDATLIRRNKIYIAPQCAEVDLKIKESFEDKI